MKTLKVFLCTEVEYYSDYQKLCLYVDAIYLFQNSTLLSSHGTITYLQLVVVFLSELVPDRCLRFWVDGSGEVVGALDARSERRHRLLAARRECRRGVTSSSWQHQTGLSGRPGGSILLIKYVGQLRSRCAGVTRAARAERVVGARRWICEWSGLSMLHSECCCGYPSEGLLCCLWWLATVFLKVAVGTIESLGFPS